MKTNKLIAVIALGGLVAFGTLAQAQDATNTPPAGKHNRPGGSGGPQMGEKLAQELGLSLNLTEPDESGVARSSVTAGHADCLPGSGYIR